MNNPTLPLRHARALLLLVVLMMGGILAGLVFLPVAAHAAPDKVVYELSKECSASASQFFAKEHNGNTLSEHVDNGQDSDTSWFENHYNPSLNACFMLEINEHFYVRGNYTMRTWTLINVNDNREIDNEGCTYSLATIHETDADACYRNDPIRYGVIHPAPPFKDFGDKVARYMGRSNMRADGGN